VCELTDADHSTADRLRHGESLSVSWGGNGDGEDRIETHGEGPCMLHNSSYDFSYELIPLGGSMCVRLVEAWVNQSDNRGQITQIRFDEAPFRATV